MIAGMITGSTQIGTRLMTRIPPRFLMGPGFLVAGIGMMLLTQLEVGTSYVGVILPGELLLGLGMGTAFMPAMALATYGIEPRDAGVASAMVNTSQQVGGAIGTALLNTLAASATTSYLASHALTAGGDAELLQMRALVAGFASAIWWAVGILFVAATIALTFINTGRPGAQRTASGRDGAESAGGEDGTADEAQLPAAMH
jgi:hypothetical protein